MLCWLRHPMNIS